MRTAISIPEPFVILILRLLDRNPIFACLRTSLWKLLEKSRNFVLFAMLPLSKDQASRIAVSSLVWPTPPWKRVQETRLLNTALSVPNPLEKQSRPPVSTELVLSYFIFRPC